MPEQKIITLDEAQTAAERFLQERLKGLKKLSMTKVQLASVEGIVIYQVEGVATIGGGFLTHGIERPFKVQVAAADSRILGYET